MQVKRRLAYTEDFLRLRLNGVLYRRLTHIVTPESVIEKVSV
ncbi:hypothetical protein MICAH_3250015 [Microcystis aeruginosa PCC 9809]|uniref:Uncharacterized protein n=1 Tax=Microcystis aeruginosa PCC 9809 TaxID=1160285 RepID=I4HS29_MICAE|nr:hypothetical protein MICAH_3250015 [Microcystis aeruginosa PCC 9809]